MQILMIIKSQIFNSILCILFFPKGEVLLEKLDDGLSVSESFLIDVINLLKSLGEGGLSELASFLVIVHDLVVEDRLVEGKTESGGVAGVQGIGVFL